MFGRKSMPTGQRQQFSTPPYYNYGAKRGGVRGNAQRGSRQRGRWRGSGSTRGQHNQVENAYPSQPSRTLANVIRWQRKRGIVPGRAYLDHDAAELRKQYPVSSGSQHRAKENPGPKIPPHMKLRLDEGDYKSPSQFSNAASTSQAPRFGMKMLQRMGWSPGKGLGKNEDGTFEPVIPDGLYAQEYHPKKEPVEVIEDMSAKHPVMALTELCTRHKWPAPKFEVVDHAGPDHKKSFLMKVIVNGQSFQPKEPTASKKQSKAEAAALFLESIGLYDRKKAPTWN